MISANVCGRPHRTAITLPQRPGGALPGHASRRRDAPPDPAVAPGRHLILGIGHVTLGGVGNRNRIRFRSDNSVSEKSRHPKFRKSTGPARYLRYFGRKKNFYSRSHQSSFPRKSRWLTETHARAPFRGLPICILGLIQFPDRLFFFLLHSRFKRKPATRYLIRSEILELKKNLQS